MSTAIVVDAACDLPLEYCRHRDIHILPIGISFGEHEFLDQRDPEITREFYEEYSHFRARDVYSVPPPVDVIAEYLLENIASRYDQAMLMCVSSRHSGLYRNVLEAGKKTMQFIRQQHEGRYALKSMRIMDTGTMFAGQALLAYEGWRIVDLLPKVSTRELYEALKALVSNVRVYTIPDDLYYIRRRASLRGDKGVGTLSYAVGRSFDVRPVLLMEHGQSRRIAWGNNFDDALDKVFTKIAGSLEQGLMIKAIVVSYAGNTREFMMRDSFRVLQTQAESQGVRVFLSMMSVTACINVGPGSLSVACCQ